MEEKNMTQETQEAQTTEIAKNVSSGAEKVQAVQKNAKTKSRSAQNKKQSQKQGKKKAEDARAKERVKVALKKKEEKEKRKAEKAKRKQAKLEEKKRLQSMSKAEKKAIMEKRKAERKAMLAKKRAERKARMEKRKAELRARQEKMQAERKARAEKRKALMEERQRERAHKKANNRQEKNKRKQKRQEQRENRKQNRTPGFGGWLAAVIALGAVTLGLASVVTVGAIEMSSMQDGMLGGYQSATYELAEAMEHVDSDLDRVRLSADVSQQSRILTDVLVQSRLAESDLEKLPIAQEKDSNVTAFINQVASEAGRMLGKLQNGQPLTEKDYESLQRLYEVGHSVRMQLDEYVAKMDCKDFSCYMKKGKGAIADVVDRLEKTTLEENRLGAPDFAPLDGAGTSQNAEKDSAKIGTAKAEELCGGYFANYKIKEFQCVGETNMRGGTAYNVQGYDDNGAQLFAEIDEHTGKLIRFDYYEDCAGETFDAENCAKIAEQFLTSLGYQDMILVRAQRNDTTLDFTYAWETDGVVVYPDSVRVKVCGARGVVSGMDANRYLRNHKAERKTQTALTQSQAQARLKDGLSVNNARLAIVQTRKGERTAYEFVCSYMDGEYIVYIDAMDGGELAILNLKSVG